MRLKSLLDNTSPYYTDIKELWEAVQANQGPNMVTKIYKPLRGKQR